MPNPAPLDPALLQDSRFPRASRYDPRWIIENSMGPNVLWLTDWLGQAFDLRPGMRVLDLGCGKGISSVFLAREFGVHAYAVDLWVPPDGPWENARRHGVERLVTPVHADARDLPFAKGFFDAILAVDAFMYFGTDDCLLGGLCAFLRPGGRIGMALPALMKELGGQPPSHLRQYFGNGWVAWHTLPWWRSHWERTGLVTVETADAMDGGCGLYVRWREAQGAAGQGRDPEDTEGLRQDGGEYVGFIRMAATLRGRGGGQDA